MFRILSLLLCFAFVVPAHAQIDEHSIVKIFVTSSACNPDRPWTTDAPSDASGTGFVISGERILTNAHVVEYNTYITVKKSGDARRYEARAAFVSHQGDIALLEVLDPGFFDEVPALAIGDMPKLRDEVTVVGFPTGGEEQSYSSGIVSRIEVNAYVHSNENLLTIQTDAPINPGNSGGPAIRNGQVVGIAMMGQPDADGVAYLIPPEVIRHFLSDIDDGVLDGFPHLELRTVSMENPMLRNAYGLAEHGEEGAYVYAAASWLEVRPGDILLAMDDVPVLANKKIRTEDGLLVSYSHYLTMKQVGEPVVLTLLRDGERQEITWNAEVQHKLVPYRCHKKSYPYYLYGGYLFTPLYYDFIESWGEAWPDAKLYSYSDYACMQTTERKQIVYLHSIFQHSSTAVAPGQWRVVSEVNGKPIIDFAHFTDMLEAADGWVEIGFDDGLKLRLDAKACAAAEPAIMETYGIPKKKVI